MTKFKLGDVVRKKTGGPKMTINEYVGGMCKCLWFVGAKLFKGTFSGEALEKA